MPLGLYDRTLHPSLHDAITAAARQAGFQRVMLAEGVGSASASAPLVLARTGWTLVQKSVALQPPAGTRAIPVKNLRVDAGLDMIFREGDSRKSVVGLVDAVRRTFARAPEQDIGQGTVALARAGMTSRERSNCRMSALGASIASPRVGRRRHIVPYRAIATSPRRLTLCLRSGIRRSTLGDGRW